jgi:hypothetical protein
VSLLRALRVLIFVPPILGWGVSLYAGWPGGISPDMANTIDEGRNFYFSGHQQPMFGLVWAAAQALFPIPVCVAIFFVVQTSAYWLAFALFAHALTGEAALITALFASVAGFLPPLLDFVVMVESNIQVATAWLLAVALAYAFPSRRTMWICMGLGFYGFITRSGMVIAVAPVLFACYMLTRPQSRLREIALRSAVSTAVFSLISVVITTFALGNPTRDRVLAVSQIFDIAGLYQKTGQHCVPPSMVPNTTSAEAIMAEYDPGLVGSIIWINSKGGFKLPESPEGFAALRSCWVQSIQNHPAEYVGVKARFARLFLMIGVEWAPGTVPDYSSNAQYGLTRPNNPLWTGLQAYIERSRTTLIWKGWFWLAIVGIANATGLARGFPLAPAAAALYLSALCSIVPHFLLGQAALSRYYFLPYILCVASLLLLSSRRVRSAQPNSALAYLR